MKESTTSYHHSRNVVCCSASRSKDASDMLVLELSWAKLFLVVIFVVLWSNSHIQLLKTMNLAIFYSPFLLISHATQFDEVWSLSLNAQNSKAWSSNPSKKISFWAQISKEIDNFDFVILLTQKCEVNVQFSAPASEKLSYKLIFGQLAKHLGQM